METDERRNEWDRGVFCSVKEGRAIFLWIFEVIAALLKMNKKFGICRDSEKCELLDANLIDLNTIRALTEVLQSGSASVCRLPSH